MTLRPRTQWAIVGRGLAGWHADGVNSDGNRESSSGGDLLPPTYSGATRRGYLADAAIGALVYDAADADRDAFTAFVLSGPMLDTALDPDAVNPFLDRLTALQMAPHLAGAFGALATVAGADPTYGGLDRVGLSVYRRLLERVPGIKIGTVTADHTISWHVTTSSPDHTDQETPCP